MYTKTMNKIRKALNRVKNIRIENHFRKFVAKLSGNLHIRAQHEWSGFIRPSPWNQSPGQGRLLQSNRRNTHGIYLDGPGKGYK